MKIRGKLLSLALIFALAPMILIAGSYHLSMHRLRDRVSSIAYKNLTHDAKVHLQTLVDDYGRIVQRDRTIIEAILMSQAREVENRLASTPPPSPKLYFSRDYDEKKHLPDDMEQLDKYSRLGPDGKPRLISVSFSEQVYFPVRRVDRKAIARDMACLSTMPAVYYKLYQSNSKMMSWLYTSLESGFHSSYPGHGGYPPEYDPRVREWYTTAKETPGPVWTLLPDVSTRTVSLTCSMSVLRPNGDFAGVTAIDVPLTGILEELKLPREWSKSATILQTFLGSPDPEYTDKLVIVIQESYRNRGREWKRPVNLQNLQSDDPKEMGAFM
ncbi:MAG TPA: hypothetical protein ENH84_03055, partial [Phycisphaerae bacterium]|nr:hypothetical protein [Phycisphaerae bacterium]